MSFAELQNRLKRLYYDAKLNFPRRRRRRR